MKIPTLFQNPLHVLGGAAAAGAFAVLAVALPPRGSVELSQPATVRQIEAPDADRLNERIPDVGAVLEKHLFVPSREATGQNSFPDLVVKGVFIGEEKSAIFSLKSKPQANLRVWLGEVETTLNSVTDPRDPRQPLVTFLREWPIKEITHDSVMVEHFITGEVETYEVDYVTAKKVKDDAARGYGQGIMPQDGTATAKAGNGNQQNKQTGSKAAVAAPVPGATRGAQFMADRLSGVLQRMSPQQQRQVLQSLNQQAGGGQGQNSSKKQSGRNSNNNSKNNSKKSSKK